MKLIINGDEHDVNCEAHVAGLVSSLDLNPAKVAVELNLAIVPRSAYAATALSDGDRVEIVHFIGGG